MAKVRNFEKGFIATNLINVGAKLGIFEALKEGKEGVTVPDLASRLGLHEPYLKVWCQTAYHFELLDCDDQGQFRLQPFLDEILGDRSHFRNYLSNIALSVDHVGKWFEEYPDYFRTGKIAENPYTPELSRAAYEPTKNVHLAFLFMIFPKNERLKKMFDQGVRFLDIGCGRGDLILQLARAFGNSTFVGVDPNIHGVEEARQAISKLGLEGRVSVENVRGEDLPYEEEFDMACMVVTLHEIPPNVRENVVEKAYRALKSDGQLLVLDFPYPRKLEDFRNPMFDYGILDQFFEICAGFVHLNTQERDGMLKKVGFRDIQSMTIGKGMLEFVTATK
jgi:ubiquinone/menaquinone biosynthesis C-methylase UbiE